MKNRKDKTSAPILAAGGIVLRGDREPRFAVVQLRKLGEWVLPKGKLAAGEDAIAAAQREVLEETGHRASVHEFLGTLAYEVRGRPKVVQFWHMQALGEPVGDLMRDVKAVQWLALEDAIGQLTHLREQVFLAQVGPTALNAAERLAHRAMSREQSARTALPERARSTARIAAVEAGRQAVATREPIEHAEAIEQILDPLAGLVPAADVAAPEVPSEQTGQAAEPAAGRNLIRRTWGWLRHATLSDRTPLK